MNAHRPVNFAAYTLFLAAVGLYLPDSPINRGTPGGSYGRSRYTPSRARKTRVKKKRGFRVHSFTTTATMPRHASSTCAVAA